MMINNENKYCTHKQDFKCPNYKIKMLKVLFVNSDKNPFIREFRSSLTSRYQTIDAHNLFAAQCLCNFKNIFLHLLYIFVYLLKD